MTQQYYIGVMTGTSLDGCDAVLVDFDESQSKKNLPKNHQSSVLAAVSLPYPTDLRTEMLALQTGCDNELHRSQLAAIAVSDLCSDAILALIAKMKRIDAAFSVKQIIAAGIHGQTVSHKPNIQKPDLATENQAYTVQLLSPARIAETCGVTVVSDFRARDIAAGGQGAPLVPAFHRNLLSQMQITAQGTQGAEEPENNKGATVFCNIGGFANVSILTPALSNPREYALQGFDTGPGNVLMDAWAQRHLGKAYDHDGAWAAGGTPHAALLSQLLQHPFFAQTAPKSTGREAFNVAWLDAEIASLNAGVSEQDVQATLLQLTAHSIAAAIPKACSTVWVCGGGAMNKALMQALQQTISLAIHKTMPQCSVECTGKLGIDPQHMEALAFAWLARQCMLGEPANAPEVTGAKGPRILGNISQR